MKQKKSLFTGSGILLFLLLLGCSTPHTINLGGRTIRGDSFLLENLSGQSGEVSEGIEIFYKTGWEDCFIHYNADSTGWTDVPGILMGYSEKLPGYKYLKIPASTIRFVFTNNNNDWDNNRWNDYYINSTGKYRVADGAVSPLTIPDEEIEIHYASGWEKTNIHYNGDKQGWTALPGTVMEKSPLFENHVYIKIAASELQFVFNDSNNIWDNNRGNDYVINSPGKYKVSDSQITPLEKNGPVEIHYHKFDWEKVFIHYAPYYTNSPRSPGESGDTQWKIRELNRGSDNRLYKDLDFISLDIGQIEFYFSNGAGEYHKNGSNTFTLSEGIYIMYRSVSHPYDVTDLTAVMDFESVETGARTVKLTWRNHLSASGGFITRSTDRNGPFEEIRQFETLSTFSDTDLQSDSSYFYKIISFRGTGNTYEEVESEVIEAKTTAELDGYEGVFKLANSWGTGWSSENVPDGFLYLTYEAAVKNRLMAWVAQPKTGYRPGAAAVIQIDHESRNDCGLTISIGDPASSPRTKSIAYPLLAGGEKPFCENKIMIDITELLPIENEQVTLSFYDAPGNKAVGVLQHFSLELYEDYDQPPVLVFSADDLPKRSVNGGTITSMLKNVTASLSLTGAEIREKKDLHSISRSMNRSDLEALKSISEDIGPEYKTFKTQNLLIDGEYGTGFLLPSNPEWEQIYREGSMRILDSSIAGNFAGPDLPEGVDHSKSIYFPPIGSQGREGSCTSWSVGYYTATFYAARDKNFDLSSAAWRGGRSGEPLPEFQDRILSPDFLYHLINDGRDSGSSVNENMRLLREIGISSWKTMPYDDAESTLWPKKEAWKEAALYRTDLYENKNYCYYLTVKSEADIKTLKALLARGYLITIGVDSSLYKNMTINDVWTVENYQNPRENHANTIVGFEDSFFVE